MSYSNRLDSIKVVSFFGKVEHTIIIHKKAASERSYKQSKSSEANHSQN
jgi:hypothetical protein